MPLKCETHLLQDHREFAEFLKLIRAERIESYLEIGSKNGGSLWRIATSLPRGSRVVSVDLPHGDTSFKQTQANLEACVDELCRRKYDARLIIGDSTNPAVIERAQELAPFDLVFIDGNHTEPFVRKDWANYGPMARMVAFHDISHVNQPHKTKKLPIDAMKVWNEIKGDYRHVEIRHSGPFNGIGVLWRS